jgi:hypothetical protein
MASLLRALKVGVPIGLVAISVMLAACGSDGSDAKHCTSKVRGYSGSAGECEIAADCDSEKRRFICAGADAGCACTVQEVVEKNVAFDPKYCAYSQDAGARPNVDQALGACGWSF